ncbi:helix-turn-helix domain-containing protein [Enterococcus cecorum]
MRTFSYKKLFKKLIDLDMTNNELMEKANISKSTFYKIKNGQNVTTDVLLRICNTLECNIEDIIEINDIKEIK